MNKLTCTFLFTIVALSYAGAAEVPVAKQPSDAPHSDLPALELKNKSSFTLDESERNPFWPIGWKPAPKVATHSNEAAGPDILPGAFLVSSILLDPGAKYAIINGKTMQEGQVFGLQMGSHTYQLTVKSIEDGRVVLMRRDQEIVIPLRRK
ncbi:MAG: hypothetical protein M3Z22_00165 [Verrucomicrobiota bacterium]|nr:hypothetical protein [Verrucomicrobiota bacterium]